MNIEMKVCNSFGHTCQCHAFSFIRTNNQRWVVEHEKNIDKNNIPIFVNQMEKRTNDTIISSANWLHIPKCCSENYLKILYFVCFYLLKWSRKYEIKYIEIKTENFTLEIIFFFMHILNYRWIYAYTFKFKYTVHWHK